MTIETLLVGEIAFEIARLCRAHLLEAGCITAELNPPILGSRTFGDLKEVLQAPVVDPGLPSPLGSESIQKLVNTLQRYESASSFKSIQETSRARTFATHAAWRGPAGSCRSRRQRSCRYGRIEDDTKVLKLSEEPPDDEN